MTLDEQKKALDALDDMIIRYQREHGEMGGRELIVKLRDAIGEERGHAQNCNCYSQGSSTYPNGQRDPRCAEERPLPSEEGLAMRLKEIYARYWGGSIESWKAVAREVLRMLEGRRG